MYAAVIALTLSDFSNDELAALNNAIQMFGTVPPVNIGYNRALEAQLIKQDGNTTFDLDDTRDAFAYEVNRRVEAGTFV